jgi:hypothetical protein
MCFLIKIIMTQNNHKVSHNQEFYANCDAYFESLRKKGKTDYNFEDEYYFTMPAISNH